MPSIQPPTYGNDMVMVPRTAEGDLLKGMGLIVGTDDTEQVEPHGAEDFPRFICMQDAEDESRVSVSYLVAGKLYWLKAGGTIDKNDLVGPAANGEWTVNVDGIFAAEQDAATDELFLAAYVGVTTHPES